MRVRGALSSAALLLSLWTAAPLCWAKKDGPAFAVRTFDHIPENLQYFEDSDVIVFQDITDNNLWRSDDAGATWKQVADIPEGETFMLFMHEYDPSRAYVITQGLQHYRTEDKGKTWQVFMTDAEMSIFRPDVLTFNAGDPDRIIFNGMDCQGLVYCDEVAMYTLDGFRSDAIFLRGNTAGCLWARSSPVFTTGDEDLDKNRILCIVRDDFSPFKQDQRLLISDNFFSALGSAGDIQEYEPNLDTDRAVQGVINIAAVKKFLLVATTSMNTDELALFVTDDAKVWHRAMFPTDHRIDQEAYTVLESTDYSIQIDVMTTRPSNPMGVMLTSNSNGTYFTRNVEHTNRNVMGNVDFEKIAGIQGIFLVNKVDNWEAVEANIFEPKNVITEITFDDGRTFEAVKADGQRVHLHSMTELSNIGRVYSSPAPGLVMGNGNTGDFLEEYSRASLFISDDAGRTWKKGPDGPHKYEFGDQGSILLAVHDSPDPDVDEIRYSIDHGQTWETASLPDNLKLQPWILTTTPDSSSLKFMLIGRSPAGRGVEQWHMVSIDFDGLHESTCRAGDMEDWFARVNDDGQPSCLMGHVQMYSRRKKNAECFLKDEFKDPVMQTTDCDCTDEDFECDFNFRRDGIRCVRVGPISSDGACKNRGDTFMGSSGWRLIPGNTCRRHGSQKDDLIERPCDDSLSPPSAPASGKVESTQFVFKGGDWGNFDKHYLERGDSSSSDDETIIARPAVNSRGGDIYITHDHGKTWTHPEEFDDYDIWTIIPHYYFKDMAFFITDTDTVIYTADRGQHFHSFTAPSRPPMSEQKLPLSFHPDRKDWLIWIGEVRDLGGETYLEASFSEDRGDNWKTIGRYVDRCEFTGSSAYKFRDEKQILCLSQSREDGARDSPMELVSSDDWFASREVHETNVRDFATMAEFIVVATEDAETQSLRALASVDGKTYAEAHFPYNFEVTHQHAYTVLDSSTHAVNLFVVEEGQSGQRYGSIIKSNSNGTSYVLSVSGVNCNDDYYVDFEKMLGLEGIILVNVVANRDKKEEKKVLQTKISHNDGAEWAYLAPPQKDAEDKDYGCHSATGDANCALHIHGYTERDDHRKTYSSESAVGLMFGLGNVGSSLGDIQDADTFMTTDAGITWKSVKKGQWSWSFGDQGSIVVLVPRKQKTNIISYSTDEGKTWSEYKFYDSEVDVLDLTTLRSGSSRNFLIWARSGGEVFTVNIDFAGLADRPCEDPVEGDSDYYLWSPKHPLQNDDCLFGHVSQYLRKKTDRTCYNGVQLRHLYSSQDCACTRRDFEWYVFHTCALHPAINSFY